MHHLLFNGFSALAVIAALVVVCSRNAVNGAMALLVCLGAIAGLFVGLQAYLLAFLLILVYAGAVVALFLFIIMLLDMQGGKPHKFKPLPLAGALAGLGLLLAGLDSLALHGNLNAPQPAGPGVGAALKPYAAELFTTYLLPVQAVGFLLLIAMVGVIVLSRRVAPVEDPR